MFKIKTAVIVLAFTLISLVGNAGPNYLMSKEVLEAKTPEDALNRLKAGNKRFSSGNMKELNFMEMVKKSEKGQYPAAIVLSCIDSRVPVEIVFDQGVGNVFVARTAGNVLSEDTIAGLEYATGVVGSKLIVVMGHEDCGAVESACKGVELGHITALLDKIKPAVGEVKAEDPKGSCKHENFVDTIAQTNAQNVANEITSRSEIIKKLVEEKKVKIVSAMYHTDTGVVDFFEVGQ